MNTFGVRVLLAQHPGFKNPGLLNEPLWGTDGEQKGSSFGNKVAM